MIQPAFLAAALAAAAPSGQHAMPDNCSKAAFPTGAVHGRIAGAAFVPKTVTLHQTGWGGSAGDRLDTYTLRFIQPEDDLDSRSVEIVFQVPHGEAAAGRTVQRVPGGAAKQPLAAPGQAQVQSWEVQDDAQSVDIDSLLDTKGSLRISFGKHTGTSVAGKILLCVPGTKPAWLGGGFVASTAP